MKLNVGCRLDIREGYENIDIAPLDARVIAGDARNLPYPTGSIEEIIAQDVLEHIYSWESASTLRHWFSLLEPNGKLRIRVPDIMKQCQLVASGAWDSRTFSRMVYAGSELGERHFTGFTMDRMTGLLEGVGFRIEFAAYDHEKLTVDAATSSNANLIVEAVKP